MSPAELKALTLQASGGGVLVDASFDPASNSVTVRVRRRSDRTDEWLFGKHPFTPDDLKHPDVDRTVREVIANMAGELVAHEMRVRLGISELPPPEQKRIVTLSS